MKCKTYFVPMTNRHLGDFIRTATWAGAYIQEIMSFAGKTMPIEKVKYADCAIAVKFLSEDSKAEAMLDALGFRWEVPGELRCNDNV
jgi:hypothetical protein